MRTHPFQQQDLQPPVVNSNPQHLDQKDAMIHALLDLSPLPITVSRIQDGSFVMINQRFSEIIGHSSRQIIGCTPYELDLETNGDQRGHILELLQHNDRVEKLDVRFKTKNGRIFNAQLSARKIIFENQECLLCMITDFEKTHPKEEGPHSKTKNRYLNILNSITESYYEVDLAGRFTFFNEAALTLFGYPEEKLLGMSYQEYTTPENAKIAFQGFFDVYQEKVPLNIIEYSIIRGDGTTAHVEVSASLLRDESGNPIGFYGINRDRTEQKKAEEALRRSEEKHRRILEEMEEGYYETDLKGNITDFNEALTRIHGYPPEELMGLHYAEFVDTAQADKNSKIFSNIYKTGNPAFIPNYNIIRKDGSICMAELSGYLLRDHGGKVIGFWGITRDRTEQRMAEMALQKSEEQYRLLVDNANDGIYITQHGRIKYHNPKTLNITGYSDEELADLDFADLVHPEDRHAIYDVNQHKLSQSQNPEVFTFRLLTKDECVLWVELSAIGISWEGEPANLNFLRDVTLQKRTEERLRQAQKMEAIGTLAGGIAHDFNNILSAIIGYTELAAEETTPKTMQEDNLREVLIASNRARDLVHQILAFARQSDEKLKPVMVSIIAKEALKLLRSSIPTTIEIKQNIASNAPVMGNPTQLHQILMNLCTNAAHAMQKNGGVLSVDLTECHIQKNRTDLNIDAGDYLKLSVADTGCGIAPEIINTIFDPYFTTKKMGEGTGIGLSVVQGIVEKYGGRITVDSELGKGATFTVYLPVTPIAAKTTQRPTEELPRTNEHILFVDDEASIAKMGTRMLETLGYQVTTETSSIEALRQFRDQPDTFDLVVTDMTMPAMTGEVLAGEMMSIRPDIPVVLCTGFSQQINEASAMAMGIKAFVYKPIKKSELAMTIRKALDEPSP